MREGVGVEPTAAGSAPPATDFEDQGVHRDTSPPVGYCIGRTERGQIKRLRSIWESHTPARKSVFPGSACHKDNILTQNYFWSLVTALNPKVWRDRRLTICDFLIVEIYRKFNTQHTTQ